MIKLTIGDAILTINEDGELTITEEPETNEESKDKEFLANLKNAVIKNVSTLREKIQKKEEYINQTKQLMELASEMSLKVISDIQIKAYIEKQDRIILKEITSFVAQLEKDIEKFDNN